MIALRRMAGRPKSEKTKNPAPNGRTFDSAIPLTQFGNVTFTSAAAIGNAHPGTITDPTWAQIQIELVSDGATSRIFGASDPLGPAVGAVPSDLSADGRSFSVSWQANVKPS